ncbi:TolC family protein, partial [Bacteroidota bacterium]
LFVLNGGNNYDFSQIHIIEENLISKDSIIEEFYILSPELKMHEIENQIAELNIKINKQGWLPQFEAGYESETILDDTYSGIKAGMTIPLWQNKNKVKTAVVNKYMVYSKNEEVSFSLLNDLERQFHQAEILKNTLVELEETLSSSSSFKHLSKALELGEISIIEYFNELAFYYEIMDEYIETEYQYYIALSKIYKYRL